MAFIDFEGYERDSYCIISWSFQLEFTALQKLDLSALLSSVFKNTQMKYN